VARVVAGISCAHTPAIAYAYDYRLTEDPPWEPLVTAFARAQQWLGYVRSNREQVQYPYYCRTISWPCTWAGCN
jgi:hypothetical protein